jgi:hypothetical protein
MGQVPDGVDRVARCSLCWGEDGIGFALKPLFDRFWAVACGVIRGSAVRVPALARGGGPR